MESLTIKQEFYKLDVGCGHDPQGDVNVDLYIEATSHRSGDQTKISDFRLNTGNVPDFIRADAQHLPFRDGTFFEVFSSNTIEHVENPLQMLKEIVRVPKHTVTIRCPTVLHRAWEKYCINTNSTYHDSKKHLIKSAISSSLASILPFGHFPISLFHFFVTF